jgi:anti-sigma B factor antagonist
METFRVTISLAPDRARVVLAGELDVAAANAFEERVNEAGSDRSLILVDVTDLTFCDSAGLRVLLRFAERCRATGTAMRIVGARRTVRRLFEITGTAELLNLDTDRE